MNPTSKKIMLALISGNVFSQETQSTISIVQSTDNEQVFSLDNIDQNQLDFVANDNEMLANAYLIDYNPGVDFTDNEKLSVMFPNATKSSYNSTNSTDNSNYIPAESSWNLALVFCISVSSVVAILGSCKVLQMAQKWLKNCKEEKLMKSQNNLEAKMVSIDEEKI